MMSVGGKAFTLLEVMAALVILATAVVVALAIQASSTATARKTAELSRATAAAEAALDTFLANPTFTAQSDGTFSSDDIVTVDGYTTDEFEVHQIIGEHIPLQEQSQIELDPEGRLAALEALGLVASGTQATGNSSNPVGFKSTMATQSDTSASNDFDPGTFVAVRIEVRRPAGTVVAGSVQAKPLVTLEAWLPKPMIVATGAATGATSATGAKPAGTSGATSGITKP